MPPSVHAVFPHVTAASSYLPSARPLQTEEQIKTKIQQQMTRLAEKKQKHGGDRTRTGEQIDSVFLGTRVALALQKQDRDLLYRRTHNEVIELLRLCGKEASQLTSRDAERADELRKMIATKTHMLVAMDETSDEIRVRLAALGTELAETRSRVKAVEARQTRGEEKTEVIEKKLVVLAAAVEDLQKRRTAATPSAPKQPPTTSTATTLELEQYRSRSDGEFLDRDGRPSAATPSAPKQPPTPAPPPTTSTATTLAQYRSRTDDEFLDRDGRPFSGREIML